MHDLSNPLPTRFFNLLPSELVTDIVEWIHEDKRDYRVRMSTLRSLCLTSKRFLSEAQKFVSGRVDLVQSGVGAGVLLHWLPRPENERNLLHVRRLRLAGRMEDTEANNLVELARAALNLREVLVAYGAQVPNSLRASSKSRRTYLFPPSEPSLESRPQISRHSASRASQSTRALPFRYLT